MSTAAVTPAFVLLTCSRALRRSGISLLKFHEVAFTTADQSLSHPVGQLDSFRVSRGPEHCTATERAGLLAGLQKVKLRRKPEAAALAYGLARTSPQIVLVFDLGGGTFDVSVLEVGNGLVEGTASSGDAHLGGDDFNAVNVNWVLEQMAAEHCSEVAAVCIHMRAPIPLRTSL